MLRQRTFILCHALGPPGFQYPQWFQVKIPLAAGIARSAQITLVNHIENLVRKVKFAFQYGQSNLASPYVGIGIEWVVDIAGASDPESHVGHIDVVYPDTAFASHAFVHIIFESR
jgi:hypothetical protein